MNRKFLSNLGITEDETITAILNAHAAIVQPIKDDIEKLKVDLKAAKAGLEEAKKPHEGAAEELETIKKQLADEKSAHEATKKTHADEKDAADVDALVTALLKTADKDGKSMNAAAIPKALKDYDRSMVKRKDGKIENADDVLKHFKAEWTDFFGETRTEGADVGSSGGGGNSGNNYESQLKAAREKGDMAEQLRIKREAYEKEKTVLI